MNAERPERDPASIPADNNRYVRCLGRVNLRLTGQEGETGGVGGGGVFP